MSAPRARDLIESALGDSPYLTRALELLEIAARGDSTESCVVWTEHNNAVHTVALVGMVAGAIGAGRIHLILGADHHVVARGCEVLRALGARFAMAEWPEDALFAQAIQMLHEDGFTEEARIPDFYRVGVAQVFLRREL